MKTKMCKVCKIKGRVKKIGNRGRKEAIKEILDIIDSLNFYTPYHQGENMILDKKGRWVFISDLKCKIKEEYEKKIKELEK